MANETGVNIQVTQTERAILIGALQLLLKSAQRAFTSLTQNGRHETAAATNREIADYTKLLAKLRV